MKKGMMMDNKSETMSYIRMKQKQQNERKDKKQSVVCNES